MRCNRKLFGGCALSFGSGVLLCCFLPSPVMLCVSSIIVVGVGAIMIFTC
ncbi:MAG: hypothetical protein RR246_03260 [Clostridia bacterium]